jgi:hypothetical protein
LIDEGRYNSEQLSAIDSPLSGIIQVEMGAASAYCAQQQHSAPN